MKITNSIIFNIAGGLGKNIAATAVVDAIKKKYPERDIIITSFYRDAWVHNKNVKDIVSIMTPQQDAQFYKDHIENSDNLVFRLEPYSSEDYFYRRKSLAEIWCDLYDVPFNNETPSLHVLDTEILSAENKINKKPDEKIFLIQTSGGAPNQPYPVSWARDLPFSIAEEVCLEMKNRGYRVIHLRRRDQRNLQNAEWFDLTMREVFALISKSQKRLFIDSFAEHAAAALGKPSVVTWVGNDPRVFSHPIHTNLLPEIEAGFRHKIDSFLEPYNITGALHEYPYATDRIYSVKKILDALDEIDK
jgi:hypothetical protein